MKEQSHEIQTVDVRGLYGPDALLKVEYVAAGRPGEVLEVLSDDYSFTSEVVRWCGEGYGRILESSYGREQRFLIALPTRRNGAHLAPPAGLVAV
jgi:TusA-related sulfurtransferase